MASVFDVFGRLLLDDAQFQTDVVKSGEKAGASVGQSMSTTLRKQGVKVLGAGLAAGFAVATKGLIELDNVTRQFQADTGATAEEAERAGKAINAMAGRNLQPMAEVGEALAKVHTDLGLTGDQAEVVAEQFLKFGTATRQGPAQAVAAFDDILDAWNLTADDAQGIMDKLIVSHQDYGGSIEENQAALAKLAPSLQAANLTIDDGIGLLNLFAESGVDSASAVTGMQKALTKVKSPQELQRLIEDIRNTEDPFLRAQKAAELFGSRAGAKLANVLAPGRGALEDYAITTEEAAGATEDAAEAIEGSFGNRFKLLLKGAGAALIGFGSNFGPALTGMASLVSLAGGLGGGKLATGIVKGLGGLGGKLKARLLAAILGAVVPATIAGEAVGAATAEGVSTGIQGGRVKNIVGKAASALGKVWGSLLGKAFVLGAVAVIGVELYQQLQELNAKNEQQTKDIGTNVGNQIAQGTLEGLEQSRGALQRGISDLDPFAMVLGGDFRNTQTELRRQLDAVNAEIAERLETARENARGAAMAAGAAIPQGFAQGVEDHSMDAAEAMRGNFVERMGPAFEAAAALAKRFGGKTATEFAAGILEQQSVVKQAFSALLNQQQTEMTRSQEIAYNIGVLTSKELASGLKDGRPGVRAQAEQVQKAAIERLEELIKDGKPIGKKGMEALRQGIKSKNPEVRAAAQRVKTIIHNGLTPVVADAGRIGARAANAFKNAWNAFEDFHIQLDGRIIGGFAGGGVAPPGVPSWVGERGRELIVPMTPTMVIPHNLSERIAGQQGPTQVINLTVTPGADTSQLAARRMGQVILDHVASGLREQTARTGG